MPDKRPYDADAYDALEHVHVEHVDKKLDKKLKLSLLYDGALNDILLFYLSGPAFNRNAGICPERVPERVPELAKTSSRMWKQFLSYHNVYQKRQLCFRRATRYTLLLYRSVEHREFSEYNSCKHHRRWVREARHNIILWSIYNEVVQRKRFSSIALSEDTLSHSWLTAFVCIYARLLDIKMTSKELHLIGDNMHSGAWVRSVLCIVYDAHKALPREDSLARRNAPPEALQAQAHKMRMEWHRMYISSNIESAFFL